MFPQQLLNKAGISFDTVHAISGGDINQSYRIIHQGKSYFIKLNVASQYPELFFKEKRGLEVLQQNSSFKIPAILQSGLSDSYQYLLMEWIEAGAMDLNGWRNFGTTLALMHKSPQPGFGWHENNYIGSLEQVNIQHQHWDLFYSNCRILPLTKRLFDAGLFVREETQMADLFCKKLQDLFPAEPASLLHGDLWSGNVLSNQQGEAVIIDPAVYCGHREMDIGMTKLFGGFPTVFYRAYDETHPLQPGWKDRLPITQLYPLLVHAVLFGGQYINRARFIMKQFC